MRTLIAALALAGTLALTACTSGGATGTSSSPDPTTTAPASAAPTATTPATPSALTPVTPDPLTDASAATEAVRLADAIQALIPADAIVHVDDHTQLVDKGAGSSPYFGIIRTITTTPETDATATAAGMVASLVSSGWISRESSTNDGTTLDALNSSTDSATSWFVIVGADTTDAKAPLITLQLASPDIS
ncbi:hypothetical protein [Glaciibacter psychrotolerans]|uniref:Uncharacterized protein n=1 Tax=Glaciibacter psychrotolerans TaxID=670054 RepID=A0A7Z0J4M3_9MICO|nr:hypothetical protein [Leifsonia psychrotolerans]NYJ18231.1 hypothetical protein [Leifsonia psychrotolerans]